MADIRKNLKNIFKKNVILNEGKIEEEGWEDTVNAIKKGYQHGKNIVKDPVKHLITNPIKNTFKNFAKNLLDPKKKRVSGVGHTAHHPVSPSTPSPTITNPPSSDVGGTTSAPDNKPKEEPKVALPVLSPVKSSPTPVAPTSPVNNTPEPVPTNPSPEPPKTPDDITKTVGDKTPPSEEERLKNRWDAIDALVPWRTRTKDQYKYPHPAELKYKNDPGFQSDLKDIEKKFGPGPKEVDPKLSMKPTAKPYSRPGNVSDIDKEPEVKGPSRDQVGTKLEPSDNTPPEETDDDNLWTQVGHLRDRLKASSVVLNPQGIELHGVEDPTQKEKKIVGRIKQFLIRKNSNNKKTLASMKRKYNLTSEDPITEVSTMDPGDKARKTIIKGVFANGFYKNCYENMLENLRKMNIISENKIDYSVFKDCARYAIAKAQEQNERRYNLTLKKVKNLDANVKQAESGARNAQKLFANDIKEICQNNKDQFTIRESKNFSDYFAGKSDPVPLMVITEAEVKQVRDDAKKEDDIIRINDYVWWMDQKGMGDIVHDPNKRAQLQFEGKKIQFVPDANGKMFNGTAAVIQLPNGEKQQVDIRNLDVPRTLAKTLIKFGKVIGSENNQLGQTINNKQIELAKMKKDYDDMKAGPNPDAMVALNARIRDMEDFLKTHKGVGSDTAIHGKVNIQLFIAKDMMNVEKTLATGGTKITPDQSNTEPVSIDTKYLTKLNKKGKMSLLKLIEKHFIAIGLLVGIAGLSIDLLVKGVKALGDKNITGSHHETNF